NQPSERTHPAVRQCAGGGSSPSQPEPRAMTGVDIAVIAVIGISALIAFLRGFVREMLTIGSWLGASAVTLYGFPLLQNKFEQLIPSSKLAAHLVGGGGLFIGS